MEWRDLSVWAQIIVVVRKVIRGVAHDVVCRSARGVTRSMQVIVDGRVPKDSGVSEVRVVGWCPKLVTKAAESVGAPQLTNIEVSSATGPCTSKNVIPPSVDCWSVAVVLTTREAPGTKPPGDCANTREQVSPVLLGRCLSSVST
jgi:hypothetical protein